VRELLLSAFSAAVFLGRNLFLASVAFLGRVPFQVYLQLAFRAIRLFLETSVVTEVFHDVVDELDELLVR